MPSASTRRVPAQLTNKATKRNIGTKSQTQDRRSAPFVKGNSATGRTKPATLETGLTIQVPEYLAQGERVKVDSRTGEFLSRA